MVILTCWLLTEYLVHFSICWDCGGCRITGKKFSQAGLFHCVTHLGNIPVFIQDVSKVYQLSQIHHAL